MSRELKNYLMFEFFVSSLTPMSSTLEQANAYTDAEVSGAVAECKQYTDDAIADFDISDSNAVKGISVYAATHDSGANVGSGTWIAGGSKSNYDFVTRAKSAVVIGSDSANKSYALADLVAIGDGVMGAGKVGEHNIGIGLWALHSLNIGDLSQTSAGDRNIAIGSLSYPALTTGRGNTGLGRDTAQCCVRGSYNIALGYRAMGGGAPIGIDKKVACWWEGNFSNNIAIGLDAAHDLVSSVNNLMMGNNSGYPIKNGSWNNIIGYNAGATLEKTRSYNGKKLIINDPYENATYSTNGTDLITVNHADNKAEQGNYVIIAFTSGVIKDITTSRQLLYVVERTSDYFILQAPVPIAAGNGNAEIREYEIDTVETLPTATSSNIIGVAACQLAETVRNSNIIGMRAAAATECSASNVMGFGAFYGNTDVGNCENSDVIGKDACYNVNTCKYSQIIGYQSAYNTIVKLEEASIQGYQAARNCPNVFKSNVFGSNAAIGVTSKIELSVINGAYAAAESETITKAVITGHNAAKRLTMCNESNIIGEGSCVNQGTVNLSNIIGQGILLNSPGYVVEDSDIIGTRACYNSENLKFTVGVGRGSLTNTKVAENTTSVGASNQHVFDKLTNCSFFGYAAGQNTDEEILELTNCTCIGFATGVTGDNQIQLGNGNTTTYVYGTVQNRSDVRDKADIRDTVLGLDFIKKLKPVDYKWDLRENYIDIDEDGNQVKNPIDGSRKRNRYHHGFIAQDIEKIIEETGTDFGAYQDHAKNGGSDVKSLGYDEFIAPLVKAVQELSQKVETLENELKEMRKSK